MYRLANPFDIGAEARLAGEVEGDVDAEPARRRHRVDEAAKRRLAAEREVARRGRNRRAGSSRAGCPAIARGERRRVEPGGIDQISAADGVGLVAADRRARTRRRGTFPPKIGVRKHDHRAGGLGLALIGEHQRMAVDDPGRWRQQCRDAVEFRFEPPRLGASSHSTSSTPLAMAAAAIFSSAGISASLDATIDFAQTRVRHPVVAAIGVKPPAALDAGSSPSDCPLGSRSRCG